MPIDQATLQYLLSRGDVQPEDVAALMQGAGQDAGQAAVPDPAVVASGTPLQLAAGGLQEAPLVGAGPGQGVPMLARSPLAGGRLAGVVDPRLRGAPQIPPDYLAHDPAAAVTPVTEDERSLASQAGFAGAGAAVAPLMGDWRTSPMQVLTAALTGYSRAHYGAQQDLADRRMKTAEFDLRKQQIQAEIDQSNFKIQQAAEQKAQLEASIAALPPEVQKQARALAAAGDEAGLGRLLAPEKKTPATFGSAEGGYYVLDENGQPRQVVGGIGRAPKDPPELIQLMGYRSRMPSGPDRDTLDAAIHKLTSAGSEPLVAIQTPEGPRYVPREQAIGGAPAAQREAGAEFTQAKDLRVAYEKLTADPREVVTSYNKIKTGFEQGSGPGDIAGIFGYMKMLDPTSVVRESEYATAANAAGVPETIRATWNRLMDGQQLSPHTRKQILSAAASQLGPYKQRYEQTRDIYTGLAERAGIDPKDVATPLEFPETGPSKATAPGAPAPATTAPEGTKPPPGSGMGKPPGPVSSEPGPGNTPDDYHAVFGIP